MAYADTQAVEAEDVERIATGAGGPRNAGDGARWRRRSSRV